MLEEAKIDKKSKTKNKGNDLEIVDVLNPDGTINCPECSDLHGRDRFEVRELVASKLEDLDLLELSLIHI